MKYKYTFCIIVAFLLAFGCSPKDINKSSPPPVLVSLSIAPAGPSIAPGTTSQFTATGHYSNNTQQNLTSSATWSSSDTGIATISNAAGSKGLAAAAAAGSTSIEATVSGITGTTMLTASPVTSMIVTPSTPAGIAPGTTKQFAASGTLQDGTVQDLTTWATWTSLDSSVALVSDTPGSKGLATAVIAPGTAGIRASFGGVSNTATLTTLHVAAIAITPATGSIPKGTTQQFTAAGTLNGGTAQDLTTFATWTTSTPAVATISNASGSRGLATALELGSTGVTAIFDSVISSSATLTVTAAVLESITITPTDKSVALGNSQQFIATGNFSDGTAPDITSSVTWHSSNPSVVTVSNTSGSKGLASTLAEGTAAITATLSGITSNAGRLTVTAAELATIIITPASVNVPVGATQNFTATAIFTDGTSQNITTSVHWNSSATSVATISNAPGSEGVAFVSYTGSTNITATLSGITSNTAVLTGIVY